MAKLQWQDCVGRKKIGRSIDDNKFFISRGCIIEHVGVRGTCVLRDWTATRRRRKRMGKEKHQCGIFWFSLGTVSTAIFLFPLSLFLFFSALSRRLLWWGMHARSRGCIFYEPRERTTQRRPNNRTSSYFRAKRENFDAKTHECHEFSRTDSIDFWLIFDGNRVLWRYIFLPPFLGRKM